MPEARRFLGLGSTGEEVSDLARRLGALGFGVPPDEHQTFGPGTEAALRRFQQDRGLLANGRCDQLCWSTLVEAGYQLGDRLLYLRMPMMRGDDVAELQRRVGALGFDPRWLDGIFGPDTERALKELQRNTGITVDGVCGPDVVTTLQRLGARRGHEMSVAAVREGERLRRAPQGLIGRKVAVGEAGGLGALAHAVGRRLTDAGATAVTLHDPDPSQQAEAANRFAAEAFIGLTLDDDPTEIAYYATEGFESQGGRRLAEWVVDELRRVFDQGIPSPRGLRVPVLRETRMPAVLCLLGPPSDVVGRTASVAEAVDRAIERWTTTPVT